MKKLLGLCLCLAIFSACDKECEPPAAAENIIGKWANATNQEVEFKSGGELIDDNDAILGNGDPEAVKSYTFIGSDTLSTTATSASGSTVSVKFGFENTGCDDINLGFLGINVPFSRVSN